MITMIFDEKNVKPNGRVKGSVTWQVEQMPKNMSVRLFWYTQGRGTEDLQVVDRVNLEPALQGQAGFEFIVPEGPYSFSGKLISLIWAVEAVVLPGGECVRETITVSPSGNEILLGGKS